MELNKKILDKKVKFCNYRNIEISDDEFAIILITLPAFLVANSDNEFDEDERNLMANLLYNFLYEIYGKELNEDEYEQMILAYLEEFLRINEHTELKNMLMGGLKLLCTEIEGLAETVKEMIQEVAEVSDGVSQEENDMIESISNSLDNIEDFS